MVYDGFINEKLNVIYFFGSDFPGGILQYKKDDVSGLALAKKYASEGWSVCIADIQDEEGIKVAAHLNEEYANDCFFQHLDITSDTQWRELIALISERWQGLGSGRLIVQRPWPALLTVFAGGHRTDSPSP